MRVEAIALQLPAAVEAPRLNAPAPEASTAQSSARLEAVQAKVARLAAEQVQSVEASRAAAPEESQMRSRIRVDESSNRFISQVVNENNEVIRQYPPEALLEFTARFRKLQGLLFDEQV